MNDPTQPVRPQNPVPPPGYQQPGYQQPGYQQPGYPLAGYPQPGYLGPGYPPPPPPVAPNGQPLAEFADRLLARLIDIAILTAANSLVVIPGIIAIIAIIAASTRFDADTGTTTGDVPVLAIVGVYLVMVLLILAISYVYDVEMMYRRGQTIGKRTIKVKIISVDPSARLTRGAAAKRWLATNGPGLIIPFWGLLDGLWQLGDRPYRQCLHDKFASTLVVKIPA